MKCLIKTWARTALRSQTFLMCWGRHNAASSNEGIKGMIARKFVHWLSLKTKITSTRQRISTMITVIILRVTMLTVWISKSIDDPGRELNSSRAHWSKSRKPCRTLTTMIISLGMCESIWLTLLPKRLDPRLEMAGETSPDKWAIKTIRKAYFLTKTYHSTTSFRNKMKRIDKEARNTSVPSNQSKLLRSNSTGANLGSTPLTRVILRSMSRPKTIKIMSQEKTVFSWLNQEKQFLRLQRRWSWCFSDRVLNQRLSESLTAGSRDKNRCIRSFRTQPWLRLIRDTRVASSKLTSSSKTRRPCGHRAINSNSI